MGSNKSNTNSSMGSAWRAVQNGSNASTFGNDEDDTSGMAWVKKRRAARERAKLEAEKMEPQPEGGKVENSQTAIAEEEVKETPQLPKGGEIPPHPDEIPTADLVVPPEHITTAINLPPQRAPRREQSSHRAQIPQVESPVKEKPSFGVDVFDMDLAEGSEVTPEISEPSADSTSEDEDDEESSTDEDDEDESDVSSEVRVQVSVYIQAINLRVLSCRRMRTARRRWGQVSRK